MMHHHANTSLQALLYKGDKNPQSQDSETPFSSCRRKRSAVTESGQLLQKVTARLLTPLCMHTNHPSVPPYPHNPKH